MKKNDFLSQLERKLSGLPQEDIDERLAFYREMIDDRMEDGLPEETAVAEIGSVDQVFSQIMADIPLARLVKEKVKPRRSLKAWEIVLLALGSPLWISLCAAALAVGFSLYVVLWSLVIVCCTVAISLAACTLGGVLAAILYLQRGNMAGVGCALGAGLVCAALAILAFVAGAWAAKNTGKLTRKILIRTKSLLIRKEAV